MLDVTLTVVTLHSYSTMSSVTFRPLPSYYRLGLVTPHVSLMSPVLLPRNSIPLFLPVFQALGIFSRTVGHRRWSAYYLSAGTAIYFMKF